MAEIKLQEGESIENALRRFKRKVQQEDIIKDIKKHSFYMKPGDKRRAKQALARKRSRKKIRREASRRPCRRRGRPRAKPRAAGLSERSRTEADARDRSLTAPRARDSVRPSFDRSLTTGRKPP